MNVHETLVAARDLLVDDGWCARRLIGDDGSHCAVGAVCEIISPAGYAGSKFAACCNWHGMHYKSTDLRSALEVLARHTPVDHVDPWTAVVRYNNSRNGFMDILAMFDAAIAETVDIGVAARELVNT